MRSGDDVGSRPLIRISVLMASRYRLFDAKIDWVLPKLLFCKN